MADKQDTIDSIAPERIKLAMTMNPGSFITDRGLEIKRSRGDELLVSHRGLKSGLESILASKSPAPKAPAPAPAPKVEKPAAKPGPKAAAKPAAETEKKAD